MTSAKDKDEKIYNRLRETENGYVRWNLPEEFKLLGTEEAIVTPETIGQSKC